MARKEVDVPPPSGAGPFFNRHTPMAVLLAAAGMLYVVAGTLSGRFSLADDHGYIVQYGHYDRPLNLAGLVQMFSGISKQEMLHDYYRPIYTLVRSVDYRLYGTSPTGYHVTSLLFYLLAVGSVFWILRALLPSVGAAFVGALLFAFHPLHVEAVAWIMAGGYAIAGALALLSFALYLSRRTFASTLAFAAAALANPPTVILPALLWGHLWLLPVKDAAERRRRWMNLLWMSAVAGLVVYLNFVVFPQRYARAFFDSDVAARSWLANFFAYLRLLIVPLGLQTPYEGYIEKLGDPRWMAGTLGLLLLGVGTWVWRKRHPVAAFGIFWFLVGILPTVSVWKNATGMADRYVLLASFGFVLAVMTLVGTRSDGGLVPDRFAARARKIRVGVGVLFLVFFAAVTWQRVRLWHDTERLFTDTVRKDPRNIFAVRTLGRYYSVTMSTPEKGGPYLEKAIQLTQERIDRLTDLSLLSYEKYNLSELRNELGIVKRETGLYPEAVAMHERAIEGIPNTGRDGYRTADYYFQMGLDYDKMADRSRSLGDEQAFLSAEEKALWCYQQSSERLPVSSQAYQNAGLVLFRLGRAAEAARLLERALALTPNNVEVVGLLAKAYMRTGEQAKAGALIDEAIQKTERRHGNGPLLSELQRVKAGFARDADPRKNPDPRIAAGQMVAGQSFDLSERFIALFRERKYGEALAVALSQQKGGEPPDPVGMNNIGLCYYKLARYPEAERIFLEAIKLRPDYGTALDNLSLVYAKQNRLDLAISYAEKAVKLQPGDTILLRRLEDYRRRKEQPQN